MTFTETTARQLLLTLPAPNVTAGQRAHLMRHVELVLEAAEALLQLAHELELTSLDHQWVRCGVLIHDIGKLQYPQELSGQGNNHENAGYPLCLEHDVPEHIARCAISHGQWQFFLHAENNPYPWDISLEELFVAAADTLWKGVRKEALETALIRRIADTLDGDYWSLWLHIDQQFEDIASLGDERLQRSQHHE